MDDQFEKDLRKRISQVFDNYEDTAADEGWQRLREKFPEKTNKRPIAWLWWSSAAAVVLVLIGILWLKQTPVKQQQYTVLKNHGNTAQPQTPAIANTQKRSDSTIAVKPDQMSAGVAGDNSVARKTNSASALTRIIRKGNKPGTLSTNVDQRQSITNGVPVASNQNSKANQTTSNPASTLTTSAVKPADNTNANSASANTIAAAKPDSSANKAPDSDIIASSGTDLQKNSKPDNGLLAYNSVPSKQRNLPGDRRVRFGVYAATFFNYAKGSNSQFNIGAGLTSDIRITRKLKLSTGIAISQNSLSYGGQPLTPVPQGINLAPLALYSANTLQYSMSEPSFKSYNANLVGIEIPIDLKYTFDPGKTETYVLAGLSSGTFLNETYTYNFNGALPQNQLTRRGSGGFYLGRTLNLAIGTGYRVGNNRLIIEPFLKYPLDGMGAQQIRFGSGGVNLRFNIPSIKR
ncbi:MAG: outer membrane beta-barrel protein [Bacteroidetes bacterium]|nr:outer membrane beta-barrel protein [Bacteroidota bacterium]